MTKICLINTNGMFESLHTFFARYPYIPNKDTYEQVKLQSDADIVITSSSDMRGVPKLPKDNTIKIFILGEIVPFMKEYLDSGLYDYAFTCYHIDHPRHFRLPHFVSRCSLENLRFEQLIKSPYANYGEIAENKSRFCNFIYTNNVPERTELFLNICKLYKRVDSAGSLFPNVGNPLPRNRNLVPSKLQFANECKFTIAYENCRVDGYTSEKIVEPMFVNSIPIYRGNPSVTLDFNPHSFINLNDCTNINDMINKIKKVDESNELYLKMLSEPWLPNNQLHDYMKPEIVAKRFKEAFNYK